MRNQIVILYRAHIPSLVPTYKYIYGRQLKLFHGTRLKKIMIIQNTSRKKENLKYTSTLAISRTVKVGVKRTTADGTSAEATSRVLLKKYTNSYLTELVMLQGLRGPFKCT